MGIIVDLIIILIIALSTYLAYRKGLVALAIKLCAVIISLVVTLILYRPISNLIINTTSIDETIQNAIYEKASSMIDTGETEDTFLGSVVEQAKTGAITQTARELSVQIINISVIIILFVAIKFGLKFVTFFADKVSKLPIINQFNKAGGIAYGLIRGLVYVYAILLIIGFVGQINPENPLHESVENSSVGKLMYENNAFNILIK